MKIYSFRHKQLFVLTAVVLFIKCVTAAPQVEFEEVTGQDYEDFEAEEDASQREDKLLITYVNVKPTACVGTNGNSIGTCMPSKECTNLGGAASGTCANGLGTCCIITKSCGASTKFNNTYFVTPGTESLAACTLTVNRVKSNICQIRLDFEVLQLSQPDPDGNCNNDFFTVTGGTNKVPLICGENNGQHMYVNVETNGGPVRLTVDRTTTASRTWKIKISQIACDSRFRAPDSCLQYFTETSGVVESFNFNDAQPDGGFPGALGTRQIAKQDYGVCIQRASGYCGIAWERDTTVGQYSFSVSFNANTILPGLEGTPATGANGTDCLTDYVIIPGGTDSLNVPISDRFCGLGFPTSVMSTKTPFTLYVVTDENETPDGSNRGFRLTYRQKTC